MSLLLLIDTSSEEGYVALFQENTLIDMTFLPKERGNSKYLSVSVQDILSRNRRTADELTLIGVGTGPGLFSGIRVGASFAKGLSLGLNIPLKGFSSWEPYLMGANGPFFSAIDLKNGTYCVVERERNGEEVTLLENPIQLSLEEMSKKKSYGFGAFNEINVEKTTPDLEYIAKKLLLQDTESQEKKIFLQYSRPPL